MIVDEPNWLSYGVKLLGGGLGISAGLKALASMKIIPKMVVAVGEGTPTVPSVDGMHVAYQLNGVWKHGNGHLFHMTIQQLALERKFWSNWLRETTRYEIPVLMPKVAGFFVCEGRWSFACIEAPIEIAVIGNSPLLLIPISNIFITPESIP
jgi:hypothetical protein